MSLFYSDVKQGRDAAQAAEFREHFSMLNSSKKEITLLQMKHTDLEKAVERVDRVAEGAFCTAAT